jgi:hypothetical protein
VYADDSILMGPNERELKHLIKEMGMRFKVKEEGDLCDYLGIQNKKGDDGSMTLTQPQLIDSILKDMKLDKDNVKVRKTPAMKTKLIHKDEDGEDFDNRFHYRSVIHKLNYLENAQDQTLHMLFINVQGLVHALKSPMQKPSSISADIWQQQKIKRVHLKTQWTQV